MESFNVDLRCQMPLIPVDALLLGPSVKLSQRDSERLSLDEHDENDENDMKLK